MLASRRGRGANFLWLLILAAVSFTYLQIRSDQYSLRNVQRFLEESRTLPATSWLTPSLSAGKVLPSEVMPAANWSEHLIPEFQNFWKKLAPIVVESEPETRPLKATSNAPVEFFNKLPADYNDRPNLIPLRPKAIAAMKRSYDGFMKNASTVVADMPYRKGTKGVVTTAGGAYLPILVVTLRMLRRTGSTLPVEVLVQSQEEYEPEICEDVLPGLNARCLILSDILDVGDARVEVSRYQLKVFAILFSTFEHVLLLDSDSMPILDPDVLLSAEPYLSHGLVTWPDYWGSTASPLFFDITRQALTPIKTRATSESGQVLINKGTHTLALLLMVYLNVYGPDYYYKLLSQGAAGEGDKETFLVAATALNATVYQVETAAQIIMHKSLKGEPQGAGAKQADPRWDYLTRHALTDTPTANSTPEPPAAFLHTQTFRLDAARFPNDWAERIRTRIWGPPDESQKRFGGRDIEAEVFEEMKYTACELERSFKTWRDLPANLDICGRMTYVYDAVKSVTVDTGDM